MMKTHCCSIVKLGTNDALTDPFSKEIVDAEHSVWFFTTIIQIWISSDTARFRSISNPLINSVRVSLKAVIHSE